MSLDGQRTQKKFCRDFAVGASSSDEAQHFEFAGAELVGTIGSVPVIEGGKRTVDEFFDELHGKRATPQRGTRIPDAHLRRVAAIYRAALASGQPPAIAVAEELHTARSNAGRWIAEARCRGFLGPATPGKSGERQKPSKRRGS